MATLHSYFKREKREEDRVKDGTMTACIAEEVSPDLTVKAKEPKKRGEYLRFSLEEKAVIAKYACENGVSKAVKHYKEKNIKESTVRDWVKLYKLELAKKSKMNLSDDDITVKSLPSKTRGRPPVIGYKLDQHLQEMIRSMRLRGTSIGTGIVIATGRALLLKYDGKNSLAEFGGHISLGKDWAKSILRRMGYTKRRANSKSKVLPHNFIEVKENFLLDIRAVVQMEAIPSDLVVNWDQTAVKLVPSSSWTMEKRGTKRIEVSQVNDKRQITAVFACTLSGKFLPLQLIYQGTTEKCHPKGITFPSDWHICCTQNHWSNEKTMIEYVKQIIIPYVSEKRSELKVSSDQSALVVFDVFKGQCTEAIFKLLDENNILYVMVPANTTDKLQPLDLSVNKPAKDFLRAKFQEWYSKILLKQLEDGKEEEVDMRLSVMKPLAAEWVIEMYHYFVSRPDIIINGFRAAGILDILK